MDWNAIRLVVFDLDGTLYDQRSLQLRMGAELIRHTVSSFDFGTLRVLRNYRRIRECLGNEQIGSFEIELVARTAEASGKDEAYVRRTVSEWMERRPLRYLERCRYPDIELIFSGIKSQGKQIAIFSDYPVMTKLSALKLVADYTVYSGDPGVGVLKPNPLGLWKVMKLAGVGPGETVLIGDRTDRDGDAARRAGVTSLIRSSTPKAGWSTFTKYNDPIFSVFLK